MGKRIFSYIKKIFGFPGLISDVTDSRIDPRISTRAILMTAFIMMLTRRGSLNAIEIEAKISRRLHKLIDDHVPSPDTIGRVYGLMDPGQLQSKIAIINHQIKRNKVLSGHKWPLRFVAVDGHEFFSLKTSVLLGVSNTDNQG